MTRNDDEVPKIELAGNGCGEFDFDAWMKRGNAALAADLDFLQAVGIMQHTEDALSLLHLDPDVSP